jgi:methylated-DNA-[protein]-cysteine S-methyltransferase
MTDFTTKIASPLGLLQILVDEAGRVRRIDFANHHGATPGARSDATSCAHVAKELEEYFAGQRTDFTLALAPRGTPFQLAAWAALRQIAYGATASYQQQATRIGKPSAVRAIGAANGKNPLPIVVPCHRVIGKDGRLVGFGGGLASKQWLLQHERAVLARRGAQTIPAGQELMQ